MDAPLRLRSLPVVGRVGVACICLVLLGGFAASLAYIQQFYSPKDEDPSLTMTDLKGAYHGVEAPSKLLEALNRGHPETLKDPERRVLVEWLGGTRISEDYDRLDLGDKAPAEIISRECLSCHARKAAPAHPIADTVPLDYFDDAKKIAFSKSLSPAPASILVVSTHAHALSLGCVTLAVGALLMMTSWPRFVRVCMPSVAALALLVDLGSWWLARDNVRWVYAIAAAGGVYNALMVLGLLAIIVDVMLPRRTTR